MSFTQHQLEERHMATQSNRKASPAPLLGFSTVSLTTTTTAARPRARSLLTDALLSQTPPTSPIVFEPVTPESIAAREANMSLAEYQRRRKPAPPLETRDQLLRRARREREEEERNEMLREHQGREWVRETQKQLDREAAERVQRDRDQCESDGEASELPLELTKSGEPRVTASPKGRQLKNTVELEERS
jgi:hypothetical protein